MNVWTIRPRCARCRMSQGGLTFSHMYAHKMDCGFTQWPFMTWYDLPKRDPGRSIHRPWLAKFPKEWRREKK